MNRLRNFLILLRARLWLLPAAMSVAGLVLAYMMLTTTLSWSPTGPGAFWLYGGDAESARGLLSALLSGVITMTSLVISLTFVSLTLAANQLGPRLIVSFIGDRQIQAVLGLFLATVLYMIIVMRTLGDELGDAGVPHLAITVASALAVACMFALLFYVHKVSRAIIADTVIERVAADLEQALDDVLPKEATNDDPVRSEEAHPVRRLVALQTLGYVQTLDYDAALHWACENDVVVEIRVRPGEYVLRRGAHLALRASRDLPDDLPVEALQRTVIVGSERSPAQDLGYFIRQIVELAVRALSPGINDPFTASAAINRLAGALELILDRPSAPETLRDKEGRLRLMIVRLTAEDYAEICFGQICQAAAGNPAVLLHLTDTFAKLAGDGAHRQACAVAAERLRKLEELLPTHGLPVSARQDLESRVRAALQACEPALARRG